MTDPTNTDEREALARIIDPEAWADRDRYLSPLTPREKDTAPALKRDWKRRADFVVRSSLAKADQIIALRATLAEAVKTAEERIAAESPQRRVNESPRGWLARQLRDPTLTDQEAYGIVAAHPAIQKRRSAAPERAPVAETDHIVGVNEMISPPPLEGEAAEIVAQAQSAFSAGSHGLAFQMLADLITRQAAALSEGLGGHTQGEGDGLCGLRAEVVAFAHLMEAQLQANDHKPGWRDDKRWQLLARLRQEVDQLADGFEHADFYDTSDRGARQLPDITAIARKRTAHVANFALMIADVCGALAPPPTPGGRDGLRIAPNPSPAPPRTMPTREEIAQAIRLGMDSWGAENLRLSGLAADRVFALFPPTPETAETAPAVKP